MYTSTVQPASLLLILHSRPTPVFKSLIPLCSFCISPSAPSPPSLAPDCPSSPPASSSPQTPSGFFNGMLEVFEPGALNCYTFFRPIPLTLSASWIPILTHFPLSRFLDCLFCDLIAPTSGLAFSLVMPCTLAAASLFSSGRAYLSLSFLPTFFLRLIPTLIM